MSVIALKSHHPDTLPHPPVFDVADAVEALAEALGATAVARDKTGGHAAAQRELIRASGLLRLTVPLRFGGLGHNWQVFYRSVRRLAEADSSLAHVFAFHHLQVATVLLYGSAEQQDFFLQPTVDKGLFWGNALNPNDRRALAEADGDGFRIDGPKSYCSGSVGSDQLTFSAWHAPSQSLLIAAVPSNRAGITIHGDWDAFGQKQTDSGTVIFDQVRVAAHEVLVRPGTVHSPRATLRAQLAQMILTNLYVGIAQGALSNGLAYTRSSSRPFPAAGVSQAVDDPYIQHRYGELSVKVAAAQALAELAAQQLDSAFAAGDGVTTDQRGRVAIAVAQAKILAHQAALDVSSQVFELTGASATKVSLGLDRFWRNARVHTLHDPVDYKLRDVGRHALLGEFPVPTPYS
jgi:alkylation response protein AidB-like acyl-CoA dehydrogenase